ncbi:MAG: hypothetical protein K6G55_01090 [Selenomonadaceae bacterium]|nr:hypothetical protein [Selenomonadaceae bacterium]
MKKIFPLMVFALILGIQSLCGAAKISDGTFQNHEDLICPVVSTGDAVVDRKINVAIIAELDRFTTSVYNAKMFNGWKIEMMKSRYVIGCNENFGTKILSLIFDEKNSFKDRNNSSHYIHGLNFDTTTGEILNMDYFIKQGNFYDREEFTRHVERKLLEYCRRENIQPLPDAIPIKDLPDYYNFYLDKNIHLYFIFQYDSGIAILPREVGVVDLDLNS